MKTDAERAERLGRRDRRSIVPLAVGLCGLGLFAALGVAQAQSTVQDLAKQSINTTKAVAASPPMPAAVAAMIEAKKSPVSPALPIINTPSMAPASPPTGAMVPDGGAMMADGDRVRLDNPGRTKEKEGDKEVPPQVKNVIEKLNGAKVDLNIEDMNQARAALARLDLLLELEQKMYDLQKARRKSEGGADGDISGILPPQVAGAVGAGRASSLAIRPSDLGTTRTVAARPPGDYEIDRIAGVNGVYHATLRSNADGKSVSARPGDTLADGTQVIDVSATSVRLREPGAKPRIVSIQNVSALSGGRQAY